MIEALALVGSIVVGGMVMGVVVGFLDYARQIVRDRDKPFARAQVAPPQRWEHWPPPRERIGDVLHDEIVEAPDDRPALPPPRRDAP